LHPLLWLWNNYPRSTPGTTPLPLLDFPVQLPPDSTRILPHLLDSFTRATA
jgi:hypothetical protein